MTYLDVWRSGTFLLYSCKVAFWIQETSPRLSDVERSVVLRSVFTIGSALAYLLFFREGATPPHVQVRHTTWLSFTRPSPALVLQATNAGARRPGYEATLNIGGWQWDVLYNNCPFSVRGPDQRPQHPYWSFQDAFCWTHRKCTVHLWNGSGSLL